MKVFCDIVERTDILKNKTDEKKTAKKKKKKFKV